MTMSAGEGTAPPSACAPEAESTFLGKTRLFLEAIKVSHSVFALPFAVSSAFIALGGVPSAGQLSKIVLAVVLARTAAMAFNRWADASIDALNPRTRGRAVPQGKLSTRFMGVAALVASAGFVAACAWIHRLAFVLSFPTLAVLLGYSFTKRFTSLSHAVLGLALGLSPLGAWIAVKEEVALAPILLGLAVLVWTAGFDVIYACQDQEFDERNGLHSLPRRLGIRGALFAARCLHVATLALLVGVGIVAGLGGYYVAGVACVAALLAYEHSIVRPDDLSKVNVAFFTLNGLVSLVFMAAVILDTLL